MAPMPGRPGHSLSGGDGYMFNPKAIARRRSRPACSGWSSRPDPGQGPVRLRAVQGRRAAGRPAAARTLYRRRAAARRSRTRKQYATVPVDELRAVRRRARQRRRKLEPPKAQEIYAVLDAAMSGVLTDRNADIDKLLLGRREQGQRDPGEGQLTTQPGAGSRRHPAGSTDRRTGRPVRRGHRDAGRPGAERRRRRAPAGRASRGRPARALRATTSPAYGFLCGAVDLLRVLLLVSDGPRSHPQLPADQLRRPTRAGSAWTTSSTVIEDPPFRTAWMNTLDFTGLALVFGYAVPFVAGHRAQRAAARAGLPAVRRLPAGDAAAGGRACCCSSGSTTRAPGLFNQILAVRAPADARSWLTPTRRR